MNLPKVFSFAIAISMLGVSVRDLNPLGISGWALSAFMMLVVHLMETR